MKKKYLHFFLLFLFTVLSNAQVDLNPIVISRHNTEGAYDITHIDLDKDGDIDFLGTTLGINGGSKDFLWFENDGEEYFTTHTIGNSEDFGDFNNVVRAGDLDGDGDIDIIGGTRTSIIVFTNNGEQQFTTHVLSDTHVSIQDMALVDLDKDMDLDILVASYTSDTYSWYQNDGNGNFTYNLITEEAEYANGASDIDAIDMDGDGDLDIIAASHNASIYVWFENDGLLNFNPRTINKSSEYSFGAMSIAAADLDKDGDIDIAGASEKGGAYVWFRNDGNQNFTPFLLEGDNSIAGGAHAIEIADVNNDTYLDILGSSKASAAAGYYWFENNPDNTDNIYKTFSQTNFRELYTKSTHAFRIDAFNIGDIDNDGFLDFYSASGRDTFSWFKNDGAQNFDAFYIDLSIIAKFSTSLDGGDLDGDGDIDFVLTSGAQGIISWVENLGNEQFKLHLIDQSIIFTEGARSVLLEDLDDDNDLDILIAAEDARGGPNNRFTGAYTWYQNDGKGNFEFKLINNSGAFSRNARSMVVDDFDADGDLDIVGASEYNNNKFVLFRNDGAENFTPELMVEPVDYTIEYARFVSKIDLDNDGDMDILGSSKRDVTFLWFENDGTGKFTYHIIDSSSEITIQADSIKGADMDNDGDQDIVVNSFRYNSFGWFENDGEENFVFRKIEIDFLPSYFDIVDLNQDNYPDLTILGSGGNQWYYINDGFGNYNRYLIENDTENIILNFTTKIDFNKDNKLDLLTISWGNNNSSVRLYLNEGTSVLSVNDITAKETKSFAVFPNPLINEELLNVQSNYTNIEAIDLKIFDSSARLLYHNRYTNRNISIPTNFMNKGMYILELTTGRINPQTSIFKILK